MIPDQGTLNETAPTKLLLALYERNQTGILYFRQNEILKVFYLNRGKISWAISSDDADRIDHVLLAKKLVAPEVLAPYQGGNKISESFGKILVENGVLSLDGLIQATREQVRLIAFSVLRWSSGNYQLVQESPPNRLVSLDVDIPTIVAQYILTQMDVNIVWEELGSLSGELQQNLDAGKKIHVRPRCRAAGGLLPFPGAPAPGVGVAGFPRRAQVSHPEDPLFLPADRDAEKKGCRKSPALDFKELDSLFGQSQANAPAEVDIEMPAMIDEAAIQDMPLAELPELSVEDEYESEARELPGLPDLIPPEPPASEETSKPVTPERNASHERPPAQFFLKPEKQKPRWLSISFLSILLAVILIGVFLWFTRPDDKPGKKAGPAVVAKTRAVKTLPAEKSAPRPKSGAPLPGSGGSPQAIDSPAAGTQAAAKENPDEGTTAGPKPPSAATMIAAPDGEAQARRRFAAGDFRVAGDIWRTAMLASRISHSILLEMDCLKASVRSAYGQLEDKENFFLLNKTSRDGRACWLVLWGRYRTPDEAALGMKLVPDYFMKQSNPPSVIELAPYL